MDEAITFHRLESIRDHSTAFSRLGDDYIISRISGSASDYAPARDPIRVPGITMCLLLSGKISILINDRTYDLDAPALLFLHSSSVVSVPKSDLSEIDAFMLFISAKFMHDININLNTVDSSMIDQKPSPVFDNLNDQELKLIKGYMELLHRNANVNTENIYSKNAGLSLVQALLYQLMQIKNDHSETEKIERASNMNTRLNYVHDFIKLVQAHHCRERQLSFYADRLFISPKYLSRLIKESTGRSAADWIDQFVLLEAKNMLRYSNKNIQQVAYALNFSTQSSFGKFFKHLTGMSPSDYQKT